MVLLKKLGVDGVFPLHYGRKHDFRKGEKLGKKDHIVFWKKPKKPEWMDEETYEEFPEHLEYEKSLFKILERDSEQKAEFLLLPF